MKDIKFNLDNNNQFVSRTIGIIKKDNKILVQGRKGKDGWGFPGGTIAYLENSEETIKREFEEEIGEKVNINKLFAIVENFFKFDTITVHQISFYYLLNLDNNSKYYGMDSFDGVEEGKNIIFKWIDLDSNEIVKPSVIFNALKENSNDIKHYIINEL